jgi:hypothetical protein
MHTKVFSVWFINICMLGAGWNCSTLYLGSVNVVLDVYLCINGMFKCGCIPC